MLLLLLLLLLQDAACGARPLRVCRASVAPTNTKPDKLNGWLDAKQALDELVLVVVVVSGGKRMQIEIEL